MHVGRHERRFQADLVHQIIQVHTQCGLKVNKDAWSFQDLASAPLLAIATTYFVLGRFYPDDVSMLVNIARADSALGMRRSSFLHQGMTIATPTGK